MPIRRVPLATQEYYHILNRGNNSIPIFKQKADYHKFLEIILYYQNAPPLLRYSHFLRLSTNERKKLHQSLKQKKDFLLEIVAYCLMPNHFHFLVKQLQDDGIFNFMRLSQNSYSHYFNLKHQRKGGLFESRFKAIRIETEAQLLHLSRYIHLNPYSSYVVKDFNALLKYPHSSLSEYLGLSQTSFCQKEVVLNQFTSLNAYKKFLYHQADYQRSLENIKHQVLETL